MKKKIEIEVFSFSDLSDEAKEKARDWFREQHDDPFMQSHMINVLKEKLDERGIKYDTDSIDVRYSLAHCQGDGFMFEGILEWKHYTVKIKHSGHYYHKYSRTIEMWETEKDNLGHSDNVIPEADEKAFEEFYNEVCDEMERVGYDEIEYQNSAEYIDEDLEANEYLFREDGTRFIE